MVSSLIYGGKSRCCYAGCWIALLFIVLPHKTYPKKVAQPCLSSCGKIPNITHPFRLKDDPDNCGDKRYELNCVNNVAVLKLYYGEYHVRSINYNNYTIRLVDPNIQPTNCSSLPRYFLYKYNFSDYYYDRDEHVNPYETTLYRNNTKYGVLDTSDLFRPIIYFNCTNPPSDDAYYVDTASCLDQHIYAVVGDLELARLKPGCRVKLVAVSSFWGVKSSFIVTDADNHKGNLSYIEVHRALDYGFELSWLQVHCLCSPRSCYINATGAAQCLDLDYCTYNGISGFKCGIWAEILAYILVH